MAQRRMFSPQIVESDEFLGMPVSSQALYFHLGMNADDDGFIQPRLIMRTVGAADDDLKVLLAKRFILAFETGVVVIKHWLIHNLIQKDRYHPTRFQDEKSTLFIKENKAYTDNADSVNKMLPEVRLGKGSEEDTSVAPLRKVDVPEEERPQKLPKAKYPNAKKIFALWGDYPKHWERNNTFLLAAEEFYNDLALGFDEAEYIIKTWYPKYKDRPFCPQINNPHDLLTKYPKIEAFSHKTT